MSDIVCEAEYGKDCYLEISMPLKDWNVTRRREVPSHTKGSSTPQLVRAKDS